MIQTEFFMTRKDGVKLYRTYSDQSFMIENENGVQYQEAVDVENSDHVYTETDIPVEDELSDTEALNIIMGRDANEPQDSAQTP